MWSSVAPAMEDSQRWLGALSRRAPCWYLDFSQTVCVGRRSFLGYSTIISNRVADDSQVLLGYGILMANGRQSTKSVSKDAAVSERSLPSFYTLSAGLASSRGTTYYDRQQPSRTAARSSLSLRCPHLMQTHRAYARNL